MITEILSNARDGKDGCLAGSMDPKDTWGSAGGRVYSTACTALCAEVYYRYSRLRKPLPADPAGKAE